MADEVKAVDNPEYDDDGKAIVVEAKKVDEGAGTDSEKKGVEEEKKETDTEEKETEEKPLFDDEAEPVIPVRKSALQHIITRKNEKIKKLESQNKGNDAEQEEVEEESEDGLSEEARGAVTKQVQKAIAPLVESLVSKADEDELKELFAAEPEAKKYDKHIRAYMGHDSWKNVPPAAIYHHLAFSAAQATGAKKRQAADLEAKQNKGGGRSFVAKDNDLGNLPSPEDIENMSDAEFEALDQKVLEGKFKK